jgi:hypothetical protein
VRADQLSLPQYIIYWIFTSLKMLLLVAMTKAAFANPVTQAEVFVDPTNLGSMLGSVRDAYSGELTV